MPNQYSGPPVTILCFPTVQLLEIAEVQKQVILLLCRQEATAGEAALS